MSDSVEESKELTLDQLHDVFTDPEGERQVSQSLQLPDGTYNSVPALTMRLAKSEDGRDYARFFGSFTGTGPAIGTQGKAGFAVSWVSKYRDDGKADLLTRLFYQASRTYRRAHELEDGATVRVADILQFLSDYAVAVRFMQGDTDNIAVAISVAKE